MYGGTILLLRQGRCWIDAMEELFFHNDSSVLTVGTFVFFKIQCKDTTIFWHMQVFLQINLFCSSIIAFPPLSQRVSAYFLKRQLICCLQFQLLTICKHLIRSFCGKSLFEHCPVSTGATRRDSNNFIASCSAIAFDRYEIFHQRQPWSCLWWSVHPLRHTRH